jgi:solute carrier family 25 iron transporter 28/37
MSLRVFLSETPFLRLWRGAPALFAGCVPSHAAYFSAYEAAKAWLGADARAGEHQPLAAAASGAVATVLHDGVLTPMDAVKQRLQLGYYAGVRDCVRAMVRAEGAASLWRAFPTTLAMNVPYAAAAVAVNESAKLFLAPLTGAATGATFALAGAVAGAVAGGASTPLDVIKTRLQCAAVASAGVACAAPACAAATPRCGAAATPIQRAASALARGGVRGAFSAALLVAADVWKTEGARGFFRGALARMAVHAPSQAISWATYEAVKKLLAAGGAGAGAGSDLR